MRKAFNLVFAASVLIFLGGCGQKFYQDWLLKQHGKQVSSLLPTLGKPWTIDDVDNGMKRYSFLTFRTKITDNNPFVGPGECGTNISGEHECIPAWEQSSPQYKLGEKYLPPTFSDEVCITRVYANEAGTIEKVEARGPGCARTLSGKNLAFPRS